MKSNFYLLTRMLLSIIATFLIFSVYSSDAQTNETCMACHSDAGLTMQKGGKTVKICVKKGALNKSVHSKLLCINCHTGFNAEDIPHKKGKMEVNCMTCHTNPKAKHPFHPSMAKATGVKGSADISCSGCHGNHEINSPSDEKSKLNTANSAEFCGNCHQQEKKDHLQSEHHVQIASHNPNSPNCAYCHKNPVTKGRISDGAKLKIAQEKLCLSCHLHNMPGDGSYAKTLVNYEKSVHGAAILKGNKKAAVCIDCHGTHKLQKSSKPESQIHQFNVPNVCGKCHGETGGEYMKSIHGKALHKGNKDAPGCSYCHGEHNIQQVPEIPKEVFSQTGMKFNVVVDNKMVYCLGCHTDEKLMSKYKLSTVEKSHQWLPSQKVHWETLRCIDCHSSHDSPSMSHNILPREETIKQCEKCHSMNSKLITTLYKHEKKMSREKYGFVNGTILSDAYVIGTTRNIYLNIASIAIFGMTLLGIFGHALIRKIAKGRNKK